MTTQELAQAERETSLDKQLVRTVNLLRLMKADYPLQGAR